MRRRELEAGIKALIAARGISQVLAALAEHPILLGISATQIQADLIEALPSPGDRERVRFIEAILAACHQYRGEHIGSALDAGLVEAEIDATPASPGDPSALVGTRETAKIFQSEAARLTGAFQGREGVLSASIHAAVGFILCMAPPPHDPAWIQAEIDAFENALVGVTIANDALGWALLQLCLGSAYMNRQNGDRTENLERAIICHEAALQVYTETGTPHDWAATQNNLGSNYVNRVHGDRGENLKRAIACYEAALRFYASAGVPHERADTEVNLGNAYFHYRLCSDRRENLERAIACYESALETRTRAGMPSEWAATQNNLGIAYSEREQDPAQDGERAIAGFEAALEVRTRISAPRDWAGTQSLLGDAFRNRLRGDPSENIERAIACYESSLQVFTIAGSPREWAEVQNNLGQAYRVRLRGEWSENLERAIACSEAALKIHTRASKPKEWATTQHLLATAYRDRLRGDRAENLEQAISYYEAALEVRSRADEPHDWAMTQNGLSVAYRNRVRGDPVENQERALACATLALEIFTRDHTPGQWTIARRNLGYAYGERKRGDWRENLEQAIACLRDATRDDGLFLHPTISMRTCCREAQLLLRLGNERWREAAAALQKAEAIFARHRGEALTPVGRREIIAAISDIGRWSAVIAVAEGDPAAALTRLEASRGIMLRETLAIDEVLLQDLDPTTRATLGNAQRRIANLRAEAALAPVPNAGRSYPVIAAELRDAEAALARAVAGYGATTALDIEALLAAIPHANTLIVPVASEFGGLIFVVPAGTTRLERRHVVACPNLTADALRQKVMEWLGAYATLLQAHADRTPDSAGSRGAAGSALETLLDWLWREAMGPALARLAELGTPVVGEPKDLPELLILPTGDFALLPLHAAARDHNGMRRAVLDDFVVSYTPSIHATKTDQQRGRTRQARRNLLALVNPTNDLPFSETLEASALNRIFPHSATVLIGESATKKALMRTAAACGYLHLSCHGSFDWRNQLGSELELAAGERLSVPEIVADLELNACRWVTLSACETGIVDIIRTPEESVGLPVAFLQAGASCVTATLWSVADESAALFFGRAYEEHMVRGLSPAQAARSAALWLRDLPTASSSPSIWRFGELRDVDIPLPMSREHGPEGRPFRSPLHWAAFSCWGR